MSPQIIVYTAGQSCMQCRLTEKLLASLCLAFELRHADELSDELRAQAVAAGAKIQAPLVLVYDAGELTQAWGGYRPDLLDELVGERSLAA